MIDNGQPQTNKPALTLFTVPKPFRGNMEMIQYNAIKSWTMLAARPEIILLGNEYGTREIAAELRTLHISDISTTQAGTPLIDSIFLSAEMNSQTPWLAYINCDCMLLDDFSSSMLALQDGLNACAIDDFLLGSQRIEIDINRPLPFNDADWQADLIDDISSKGVYDSKAANEIFLFNKGLFQDIPAFAIGRPCWDNWMVWYAWKNNAAIIDATGAFAVIHQCHDYSHVEGGWQAAWKGEEAKRNIALAEGKFMSMGLTCTHVLDKQGLHPGRLHDGSMPDSLLSRRLSRGIEEYNRGRYSEALDYFNDALERSGSLKIESLHYLTAVCFFHLKKYDEAINAIQNELAEWPNNNNAKTLLSTLRNHIK